MKGINRHFHLPEDLVVGILLRLPVKSLLRFKSVCQAWHAIISSPSFTRKHFHREGNIISLLTFWSGDRYNHELSKTDDYCYDNLDEFTMFRGENLERCDEDADHIEFSGHIFRMRGPCNGIFWVLHSNAMALWNPATRRLFEVPNCPLPLHMSLCRIYDFGMDPITGDLKIVAISGTGKIQKFAVYSLSNNSWRLLEQDFDQADKPVFMLSYEFGPTFSDGFCYWLKRNEDTYQYVILSFDLHKELFREIETPEINLEASVGGELDWYNDSLALLTYHSLAVETRVDVWSMKEQGCWTKVWNFSMPLVRFTSIGVWMKNQIFAFTFDWELVIYDTESRNIINLEYRRVENASNEILFAFPYKESLYSL